MHIELDHIVLWVADPIRSAEFYATVLELTPLRLQEFRDGTAPFPSVRVSAGTIIDLAPLPLAAGLNAAGEGTAGHPVNHLCLNLDHDGYLALKDRLAAHGIPVPLTMKDSFGARGHAPETLYFTDPDRNVIEARYYA
ncbi:VOC family protein [Actinocorallia populi]|uniref:VOC family protein n=1 Tax=Actinocorallia populi TaxID=2079200 RepID=UPI0018E54813|nr:VOC family protein [Actinocorallia populi]